LRKVASASERVSGVAERGAKKSETRMWCP
jgi:hypothetical protein